MTARRYRLLPLLLWLVASGALAQGVVVFAHAGLPKSDAATLQRLYTGRVVSIGQRAAQPLNLPAGHPVRREFLDQVLGQDEAQYTGYWLVRRYVGKGAPPPELADIDELISYVVATPGAVGYAPATRLPVGSNIIFRP
jgi:hypothetical protein